MTTTATQAYLSTTEAMKTISRQRFSNIRNAAEALREDAKRFQEDLDLRQKWINSVREKAEADTADEQARALIDDCDSFTKYMEEINDVFKSYDDWLGRLEKF